MQVDACIIGGTGIGGRLLSMPGDVLHVPTPRGFVRGRLIEVGGKRVFATSRHSAGHKVPPHKVNYAAVAVALQQLGAKACFATAAVGSLRKQWGPGTLVVCSDFIDETGRFPTLFDRTVAHTDFSRPFPARDLILRGAKDLETPIQDGGIYLCGNGPRYETPEEIRLYTQFGADVVGMTAASEAIVMREANVPYACLAIVTNQAAGLSDMPLSHEEVTEQMERSGDLALKILEKAVAYL